MVFPLVLVMDCFFVVRNIDGLYVYKFYLFMRIAFLWRNVDIFRICIKVLSCMH
jgi:hypothetical protein